MCPETGRHTEMRVADPRGVRHAERVLGRRPVHDRLLRAEPRQLQTGVDPPELGHHRVDHARGPAAGVVLADRRQVGRHAAVLRAADPRAHRHAVGPKGSDVRGTFRAGLSSFRLGRRTLQNL